jgi:hypothetical protein
MKRFVFAVFFCSSVLLAGLYLTSPPAEASNNVLNDLLNLPSPPPPNPLMKDLSESRSEEFYDEYNPPPDDASNEDLLDYWKRQSGSRQTFGYNAKPSPAVMQRLLKICEEEPERLSDLINSFPPNATIAEKVKYFYDDEVDHDRLGAEWQSQIKSWLTNHSTYFLDRLVKKARAVREDREYVTNQDDLLDLAEVDWDSAEPIVDKLYNGSNQPVSNTLAAWCLYRRAIEKGETTDIDKYREQLKAVVEDKTAGAGKRDLAFDALIREGDWEGRDEWYISLMKDETLADLRVNGQTYTGLTTVMLYSPAKRYKDRMLGLLKSDNVHVRTAAIRNLNELVQAKDPDVMKALLPWLADRKWATEVRGERAGLIAVLRDLQMPESVPGLLAVLNEKAEIAPAGPAANSAAYYDGANVAVAVNSARTAMSNAINSAYAESVSYPYRESAIYALSAQKDIHAVSPLRAVLPHVSDYMRGDVVRAIWNSSGFSIPEQLGGLETAARNEQNSPGSASVEGAYEQLREKTSGPFNPAMLPILLGTMLTNETTVSDELVTATISRIEVLQRSEPRVAIALRKILEHWHGPAMNIFALRELRRGTADINIVIRLLSQRKELQEKLPGEVAELHNASPFARGIGACILNDADNYRTIISTADAATKMAIYGCARMVRGPLPLEKVEEDLKSPDKVLALAAEHYLESEDSPAACHMLFAHFPNSMKILGARTAFRLSKAEPDFDQESMEELFNSVGVPGLENTGYVPLEEGSWEKEEKGLKQEFEDDKDLIGLYYYRDNYIRLYADRAVFRWSEDEARYRERPLKKEEYDAFTTFLRNDNVDAMPPFLSPCEYCDESQMIMLGRAGGRRLFFRTGEDQKVQKDLDAIFDKLQEPPAKLHYRMEKYLPGLEILFENDDLSARVVWKNNDDLRLLIENTATKEKAESEFQKIYQGDNDDAEESGAGERDPGTAAQELLKKARERANKIAGEIYHWNKFSNGSLGDIVTPPPGFDVKANTEDYGEVVVETSSWKNRAANVEVRGGVDGLFKTVGGSTVKIKEGRYVAPVITANGRWVVAAKYVDYIPEIVRINLLTNKEYPINLPEGMQRQAQAFIPALNRVLISSSKYVYESGDTGGADMVDEPADISDGARPAESVETHHYLLDPETGATIEIRNEVAPLEQQSIRPLQPVVGRPDIFWAAIPNASKKNTRFGTYNTRTLLFTPLQNIPEIQFDSMDAWVDETEGKIYIVYKGQLLRLPLPKPGAVG